MDNLIQRPLLSISPITSLAFCLTFLCMKPLAAADEWFPFDMSVEDFWVVDEKGFRTNSNVMVPEGTSLTIHCAWAVRPTQYVKVNEKIRWNGNLVNADGHTQGLFPIEIPPDDYGDTQWESGGVLGIGTTSHSIHGTKKLEGDFKTGWTALGAGDHKLSCVLDSFEYNIDLEKTRANNRREITVTVLAPPEDISITDANGGYAVSGVVSVGPSTLVPAEAAEATEAATFPRQAVSTINTRSGMSTSAPAPARTAAPALRAMSAQQDKPQAPPNPCSMDATYYVPKSPVIESSSPSLQVGDQVQIQCGFEKRTRPLEWPQCDHDAKIAMASLKFSQESGSRYSGMMIIDDVNIGIATSPMDGASFDNTGTWTFNEAGSHEVTCQIDNGLHVAGSGSPVHLQAGASVQIGAQVGLQEFRGFEPGMARRVPTTARQAETAPVARDGRIRLSGGESMVNPSPAGVNPSVRPGEADFKQIGRQLQQYANDLRDVGNAMRVHAGTRIPEGLSEQQKTGLAAERRELLAMADAVLNLAIEIDGQERKAQRTTLTLVDIDRLRAGADVVTGRVNQKLAGVLTRTPMDTADSNEIIQLQNYMQKSSQLNNALSSIMKSIHDTQMAIIRNMH